MFAGNLHSSGMDAGILLQQSWKGLLARAFIAAGGDQMAENSSNSQITEISKKKASEEII